MFVRRLGRAQEPRSRNRSLPSALVMHSFAMLGPRTGQCIGSKYRVPISSAVQTFCPKHRAVCASAANTEAVQENGTGTSTSFSRKRISGILVRRRTYCYTHSKRRGLEAALTCCSSFSAEVHAPRPVTLALCMRRLAWRCGHAGIRQRRHCRIKFPWWVHPFVCGHLVTGEVKCSASACTTPQRRLEAGPSVDGADAKRRALPASSRALGLVGARATASLGAVSLRVPRAPCGRAEERTCTLFSFSRSRPAQPPVAARARCAESWRVDLDQILFPGRGCRRAPRQRRTCRGWEARLGTGRAPNTPCRGGYAPCAHRKALLSWRSTTGRAWQASRSSSATRQRATTS